MKIYYDVPDEEMSEDFIESNLITYTGEEKERMRGLYENMAEAFKQLKKTMCVKQKYQIMWALRSIEQEFNEQGGCIIITKKGKLQIKDFTQELTDKITSLLSSTNFE